MPTMNKDPEIKNKLGIHALVWTGGWSHEECRSACENAKKSGYDIIEIPALDPSRIDVAYTRDVLREFSLEATVSLGLSSDADINSEDPEVVRRGEEILMSALEIVEQLGGSYLGGVLYSKLGRYERPPSLMERHNSISGIKKLAIAAQSKGITIGLEPVNRYESNLINTAQQALEFINEVGEPNVKVHLDIYHMNIEEFDLVSPVVACGEKLGYVHIGGSHRGPLTSGGNIDFDSFFGALSKIGYEGVITFESFSSEIVDPQISSVLCIWRNLWSDNQKLATDGRKFIYDKLVKASGQRIT